MGLPVPLLNFEEPEVQQRHDDIVRLVRRRIEIEDRLRIAAGREQILLNQEKNSLDTGLRRSITKYGV